MSLLNDLYQQFQVFSGLYLPLKNTVLILSITLLIILFAPLIFKRLNIPGIIGLIIAGIFIGPGGLHLIQGTESFELLSKTGLLYIMFLAGLEIDMHEFRENGRKSVLFGVLTFLVPILLGMLVCYYWFQFSFWSALLLASIFSTHTLLSYPIVSNMGVVKNRAVQVAFGGTIITDSAVLILLGIIIRMNEGTADGSFWLRIVLSMTLLVFVTLSVLPRFSRWFFRNVEGQAGSHYVFVLAVVFISGYFSELAGVEPIIGAFLAGLGLNRVIPHTGILMNRITFIGNTLFIPFFLISAGMLVDIRLFFSGTNALLFATILLVVGVLTKYLAAWLAAYFSKYTKAERNLLFGLTVSHAAATLAIIKTGFEIGMFNQEVVNATVILILVSCLISSFVTERASRKVAIQEKDVVKRSSDKIERILIPVSNPENIQRLIDFALMIKDQQSQEPLYPLSIVEDDAEADIKISQIKKVVDGVAEQISSGGKLVEILKKVDLSIVDGIARTAKAYNVTDILITYKAQTGGGIFGNIASNLLQKSKQSLLVVKIVQPLTTFRRVVILLTSNAELESGFLKACHKINQVARQIGNEVNVYGNDGTLLNFAKNCGDVRRTHFKYHITESFDTLELENYIQNDDLYIFLSGRPQTISYNYHVDEMPKRFQKHKELTSFIVYYPQLSRMVNDTISADISAGLDEQFEKVKQLTGKITGIFKKDQTGNENEENVTKFPQ